MDEFLADLYGTNTPQEADFEKVAHLDFLEKVADEEGIDLDDLSDEDLEELAEIAAEALDEDDEYEGEEYEEDFEKEAEAKVEEADFLGRVMAHSFNQEMDNIDKEAGARWEAVKGGLREAGGRARRGAGGAHRQMMGNKKYRQAYKTGRAGVRGLAEPSTFKGRMRRRADKARAYADKKVRGLGERLGAESTRAGAARGAAEGRAAGRGQARPGGRMRRAADWMTMGKRRRGRAGAKAGRRRGMEEATAQQRRRGRRAIGGAAAGGAALGIGGGLAAREMTKEQADAEMAEIVQARAWEHLMAAGLADNDGNFVAADDLDKTAADEELDYEIDAAALELLESEGYPVEWY